jgi:hypothetical protein
MVARKKSDPSLCFACETPCIPEYHHIHPKQFGGSDADENVVPLCQTCHDLIDRFRFNNVECLSWFLSNRPEHSRWANLMFLELAKAIHHSEYLNAKNRNELTRTSG